MTRAGKRPHGFSPLFAAGGPIYTNENHLLSYRPLSFETMHTFLGAFGPLERRVVLTTLVLIVCALPMRWKVERPIMRIFRGIAQRRWLAISVVFAISMVATSCLALRRGFPVAYVHDEYSNMLAADTFAHGRLTNPTPAGWEHFESMHILVRPSYQSKYPPGQGLFMALGQALVGRPACGIWISTALAAAAACWMMYAFFPPSWALLGGLLMALHSQMMAWGQGYWGGSVAVLGGCLLLGGFGRLTRWTGRGCPGALGAFWMAVGMIILALSRPFEGLVLTVLLMPGLVVALRRAMRKNVREEAERQPAAVAMSAIGTVCDT